MTTNEAYDEARAAVEELREAGICVDIKPSRSRNDAECVAKYSGPERVAPEKWIHVTFHPQTDEHRRAIAEKAKRLGWLGVGFDTGGCAGQRDWELDWSFCYTARADGGLEDRRDKVEALINVLEGGNNAMH